MIATADTSSISSQIDYDSQPDISSNAAFDGREVLTPRQSLSRSTSLLSQTSRGSADSIELPDEIIRTEGLRHSDTVLNAKRYKTKPFMDKLFAILQDLQVPTWSERIVSSNSSIRSVESSSTYDVSPPSKDKIWIHKVSGSLTNAVFFLTVVSGSPEEEKAKENPQFQSVPPYRTLLLRIYGPSSSSLINRAAELRILYVLSSRYRIGPRIYGTFGNGRVEEYFESRPLTALEMRDPQVSRWISIRMSELHRVDVRKVVDPVEWADPADGTRGELGLKRCMRSWIPPAREVVQLIRDEEYRKEVDIDLFAEQWDKYYKWVRDWEKEDNCKKESPRVFCHNDTQYGNLLRLKHTKPGMLPHQQIIVIDFEYACPNPAAFDIANQFCEWTTDYLGPNPALMKPSRYPTRAERNNFYLAYLQSGLLLDGHTTSLSHTPSINSSDSAATSTDTSSDGTFSGIASTPTLVESPTGTPRSGPELSRNPSTHSLARTPKTPQLAQFTRIQQDLNVLPDSMDLLEEQVKRWMPASHALWGIWGLVQGRENVIRDNERIESSEKKEGEEDGEEEDVMEFDYLQYAKGRIQIFREICHELGVF